MRYRALDPDGDYQFGRPNIFHVDTPAAVAQAVLTRLRLATGEWFLDAREGTPYDPEILGYGTQGTRDLAIKNRIVQTPGVLELLEYASSVDAKRVFTVTARISTIYGPANITVTV